MSLHNEDPSSTSFLTFCVGKELLSRCTFFNKAICPFRPNFCEHIKVRRLCRYSVLYFCMQSIQIQHIKDQIQYTRKNYELLKVVKTGVNNVVLLILLNVVNNTEQVVEPEPSPQS